MNLGVDEGMLQEVVGQVMLQNLQAQEKKIDEDIRKLDEMDDDDIERLRDKRRRELQKMEQKKQEWKAQGHGVYREISDQKDFFDQVKKSERIVVHFYRGTTWRCQIIDRHLEDIAKRHPETKFVKVDAEKSPFLVERLNVWMLPTLVLCKNGKTEHSIVGFDELGGDDDFSTETLEYVISKYECLRYSGGDPTDPYGKKTRKPKNSIRRGGGDSDEDYDSDE